MRRGRAWTVWLVGGLSVFGFGEMVRGSCPTTPCTTNGQCNDGIACTVDQCIAGDCLCSPNDSACEDGIFCNGTGQCSTTTGCHTIPPPTCTSPLFCSNFYQDCVECETNAQCSMPEPYCGGSGFCVQCETSLQCQDGSFCTGTETCDTGSGQCQDAPNVNCAKTCFRGPTPGATCTTDANCGAGGNCVGFCSELRLKCVQCEDNADCDNGVFCDGAESCVNDVCVVNPPPVCKRCVGGANDGSGCQTNADCPGSPAGTCTGATSFCDEANDRCNVCLNDAQCADSLSCTLDQCTHYTNGLNLCNNIQDDSICDDGLTCNGQEHCNASLTGCVAGTPLSCVKSCFRGFNAGAACSIDSQCGSSCEGGVNPGISCTSDSNCGKACIGGGPTGDPNADGWPCLSASDCISSVCGQGLCVPGKCVGLCSEAFGGCVDCEVNAPCSDNLFCDGTETCSVNGTCLAGSRVDCSSLVTACSDGTCSESQDRCVSIAVNNNDSCVGPDHCSAAFKCSNGSCVPNTPGAADPYRCVRLEWRPTTQQTVVQGSTAVLSLYAVADQCATPSDDCATSSAAILRVSGLLNWNNAYLQLQPSTSQSPNPADACNASSPCNLCQTCVGGSNPGASCMQRCIGGSFAGYPCSTALHCPGGTCYSGPVCNGGTNDSNACTTNTQCPGNYCSFGTAAGSICTSAADCTGGGSCVPAFCDTNSKCLGGGSCGAATNYNWLSSIFPNDCSSSAMNGPCPSSGFPGNDGGAFYQAIQPTTCGGAHNYPARSACASSAGLKITDFKFRALAVPPGNGSTNVSLAPCGPPLLRTGVTSLVLPPPGYTTDDILKTIGPPASIRVLACGSAADCVDNDPCTTDACNNGTCSHDLLNCVDNDLCTIDYCAAGVCHHDAVPCDPTEVCYGGSCFDPCTTSADCNDGVSCTVDVCDNNVFPLPGVCRYTASDALCSTGLFCQGRRCDPDVGCVFDHECISANGNPCPVAAACNETTDSCGGCFPPTVVAEGSRYLRVTPTSSGSTPVALIVRGQCDDPEVGCVNRFVQSKCDGGSNNGTNCVTDADCPKTCSSDSQNAGAACTQNSQCIFGSCQGKCETGTLGPSAFFKTSAQWGTVHVRGAQIRPGERYLVQAQCNIPPIQTSAANEATTWKWGDVTGNNVVDALDVVRLVDAFRGIFTGTTFQQVNHWGCTPDKTIDALDIVSDVDAFRGLPYSCPMTCP